MATQYATKEDLNYAAQVQKRIFTAKEEGKSLVPDTEIAKIGTVEENAQANVIETVKVNGVPVDVTNKAVNITVQTAEETEAAIKAAIAGVYVVKGSTPFASLPSDAEAGHVYNVTDSFTTTDAFKEGAGVGYPAGTNVVMDDDGKWDCMAGVYDFSEFVKFSDIGEITEAEIEAMYNA